MIFKIAATSALKNKTDYFPFILSVVVTIILNLVITLIANDPAVKTLHAASFIKTLLDFSGFIVMAFTIIFLIYSHNFLLKRRNREYGLYNVLGLSRKNLITMSFYQKAIILGISLIIGVVLGYFFSQLMLILLGKLIPEIAFKLSFSIIPIIRVIFIYLIIFGILFLIDISGLKRTNSLELLRAENTGEKEPKAKWIIAVIGLVALLGGYFVALNIKEPIDLVFSLPISVTLIIIGTYILFIVGSIAVLQILKRNKKYYYKANHFITVSSMLFRMKQNAAGLATIAVLTSMTLFTMITTGTLFAGQDQLVQRSAPTDFRLLIANDRTFLNVKNKVENAVANDNQKISNQVDYLISPEITGAFSKDGKFTTEFTKNFSDVAMGNFLTIDQAQKIDPNLPDISNNQVLVYDQKNSIKSKSIELAGNQFDVKKINELKDLPKGSDMINAFLIIVPTQVTIDSIIANDSHLLDGNKDMTHILSFNTNGTDKQNLKLTDKLFKIDGILPTAQASKAAVKSASQSLTGGFMFIGALLSISFTLATALIIYYKQLSEGQSDQKRFNTLQQIGMSKKEVKKTISSQILFVFFLPVAVALIHMLVALPVIYRMMEVFNLSQWPVILTTAAIVSIVIIVIYYLIYTLTGKIYYNIIERKV